MPAGGMGDVVVQHSFAPAPLTPPVLAAGVASLGSLHREWGLRIAQELALSFGRAAVGYKEAVESADSYPTHTGAAGTVTPILAPAMALLQVCVCVCLLVYGRVSVHVCMGVGVGASVCFCVRMCACCMLCLRLRLAQLVNKVRLQRYSPLHTHTNTHAHRLVSMPLRLR
jgi:hypothetical protein